MTFTLEERVELPAVPVTAGPASTMAPSAGHAHIASGIPQATPSYLATPLEKLLESNFTACDTDAARLDGDCTVPKQEWHASTEFQTRWK